MKANPILHAMVLIALVPLAGLGQSSFELRNRSPAFGVDAPVFDALGVPLAGVNYLGELWGGATPDSLAPAVLWDQGNRREIVPFASRGYFISDAGSLSVLTVPQGGWAWLQVRAWVAPMGATYDSDPASKLRPRFENGRKT